MTFICSLKNKVTLSDVMYVFFFKQKTAYEMRISDWSSDVCSSDLPFVHRAVHPVGRPATLRSIVKPSFSSRAVRYRSVSCSWKPISAKLNKIGRASCRERVCQYV